MRPASCLVGFPPLVPSNPLLLLLSVCRQGLDGPWETGGHYGGATEAGGAYLVLVAIAVAVFFIINPLLADTIDVPKVWGWLDILMVIALGLGLIYAYLGKQAADGAQSGDGVSRSYLEANVIFFAVAAVTILFLHNWFSLLADGPDSLDGNHQAWVIWAAVDTALPIVLGVLGCRLWRGG